MADLNLTMHEALLAGAEALRAIADADENDELVGYIFDRLDLSIETLRALASVLSEAPCSNCDSETERCDDGCCDCCEFQCCKCNRFLDEVE